MAWQIGVDVGGTFTDLLALDPTSGVFRVAKVPSTPEDQSVGFIAGLAVLVHGTTVATNGVLERKGARCGLITTAGFRDALELGRRTRPNPYGMTGSFEALIPRDLRTEVPERIDTAGRVLTPLDDTAVRQAISRLRDRGAEPACFGGSRQHRREGQRRLHAVPRAVSLQGYLGSARPRLRCLQLQPLHVGH
jgi:N-methylhydantoinase A